MNATEQREYRFVIDAFTPDTLPMVRLADYMRDLATLLGNHEHVHFVRLEKGSTVPVMRIDWEAMPKVRDRLDGVRRQDGPPDAMNAFAEIDKRLACDNATGLIRDPGGAEIIRFPGRSRRQAPTYGPLSQAGTFVGVLIEVGGKNDPVPVHLQEGEKIHICYAPRVLAREMAAHIFGQPLKVEGTGRWRRTPEGVWQMDRFVISKFELATDIPINEVISKLRDIGWTGDPDPVRAILAFRRGKR